VYCVVDNFFVKCRKTDFLAQLAEHRIPDPKARGSNPLGVSLLFVLRCKAVMIGIVRRYKADFSCCDTQGAYMVVAETNTAPGDINPTGRHLRPSHSVGFDKTDSFAAIWASMDCA
jgi:hypothetical protein